MLGEVVAREPAALNRADFFLVRGFFGKGSQSSSSIRLLCQRAVAGAESREPIYFPSPGGRKVRRSSKPTGARSFQLRQVGDGDSVGVVTPREAPVEAYVPTDEETTAAYQCCPTAQAVA
jgi:hypothetical protein